ncbi:hypothetical protein HZY62_15355 [Maribacter polysiphoniae]|uniref:Cytoskeletal protein CcmA (Bactofilin family) n=1 Tax=Maribacter polysiphoniae TaxID=429344 RepID=A0A316DUC2_9FLAO|nr:hypothetical protein [Maribacter polysiphoniae]MBD1261979.1 hypothetical protein [Maribacter polysiphoniae]PWK21664.1 hypothetical protein LX92_03443 [Maribacter polysiphoniae]
MKWNLKIKAGALQFVLFIGAIIAVLLMAFVLITYIHNFFGKITALTIDIVQQADFAMGYSLSKPMRRGESIDFSALDNPNIHVIIEKEFWGILEKRTSTASFDKIEYSKTAFIGQNYPKGMNALNLRDKQRPLVLAGTTRIMGDVLLPAQGIRMGNIAGNSYNQDQLVYGREQTSSSTLPKLDQGLLQQIDRLLNEDFQLNKQVVTLKPEAEIRNSFKEETLFIMDDVVQLENNTLVGNIVIYASRKIIVESSTYLADVVLVAPEIIIKDRVQGYFQAIAKKSIHVGKNCALAYPTTLVVKEDAKGNKTVNTTKTPKIFLDTNVVVNGMLLYLDTSEEGSNSPQIRISNGSVVNGEIYCSKNLELKGTVNGNVTTDGFIAMENGSIYQNHLYNGTINSTILPTEYSGILYENEAHKKVMKWLY